MATVNFTYNYPYIGYDENKRFGNQWATSQKKLNGCYTYPMVFNNTIPGCRHLKINVEVENTGSGTIYNRSWDFMVCKSNGSWVDIETFTMPDTGLYTLDCDINGYDITMFAVIPSSDPGSSRTWSSWFSVEEIMLTETFEVKTPAQGNFHYGIFPNYYGIEQEPTEVYVNIDGQLVKASGIFANVGDTLKPIAPVYSDYYTSESESSWLYTFTPDTSWKYRIKEKRISGDHELRFYSSDFTELYDGYFYDRSFDLTAGTTYYILVLHYYGAEKSESYLQIFKEE